MRNYYQRKSVPKRIEGNGIYNTGRKLSFREGRDTNSMVNRRKSGKGCIQTCFVNFNWWKMRKSVFDGYNSQIVRRVKAIWRDLERLLSGAENPIEVGTHKFLIMSIVLVI